MKKIFLLSCLSLCGLQVCAQQQPADTAFRSIAAESAKRIAVTANASQAGLYNGADFSEPTQSSFEEFPYFDTNDWITGAVHYDGILYQDVPLMYDIHSDRLITSIPQSGREIKLITEKIDYFVVNDITFVKLSPPNLETGFYGRMYDGKTKVYVRYKKSRQEKLDNRKINVEFPLWTRYYIVKDGKYFGVKTKKDILNVLADRKSDLKQFAQKENLRFKTNTKASSFIKLTGFYDSITE
jgi:hypothetical protein